MPPGEPSRTIIDVGAYVGDTPVKYAQLFPEATIHALEPSGTTGPDRPGWGTRVAWTAQRHLTYLGREGVLSATDVDYLLRRFTELAPDLNARPLKLLHGDLLPQHVLVDA